MQGSDAESALNRIATADCSVPVGRVLYSQFLNERGGIEADLTITRLRENRFMIVTAAFTATHVIAWLNDHIPESSHCFVTDVSDSWSMLNVQGPRSRELLASIATGDWSNDAFSFGTAREVYIGYQSAIAVRLSFVGELGWELYVSAPFTSAVYDTLIQAGSHFDLRHCGYHALNSLRMEKAYRDWPHDMGPDDTPFDAGVAFTCAWNKPGGFIRLEATVRPEKLPHQELAQASSRPPFAQLRSAALSCARQP